MADYSFGVITVSDRCYEGSQKDLSGPTLVKLISKAFVNAKVFSVIVPDESKNIKDALNYYIDNSNVNVIITTGGTGFSPRDITPEVTKIVIEKECPQLAWAITLTSMQKTVFAALTRGVCGIKGKTLIMNFPGSVKAVTECFESISALLPHAISLVIDNTENVRSDHIKNETKILQQDGSTINYVPHICPHKVGDANNVNDRNSPYPMLEVDKVLYILFAVIKSDFGADKKLFDYKSRTDLPPFRASIKDGYAVKSTGFSGIKKVKGYVAAGDEPINYNFEEDECFKINTGAVLPDFADCVIQIEDTKVLKYKNGLEDLVEILAEPKAGLDIRPIGCDLKKDSKVFPTTDWSPVIIRSIMASIGETINLNKPRVAILSTGSELIVPNGNIVSGKVFDSNTTMLEELLHSFHFDCISKAIVEDNYEDVRDTIIEVFKTADFIICSGGVSMGDKDFIKNALADLEFNIHFGRVNMKPGKPMTFASKDRKYFFGLPGNPVSAYVTFHLFVLPCLRWSIGWQKSKCILPTVPVKLVNDKLPLDPRPEYMRASITLKDGVFYALVNGDQISSRLQSIVGADVLVHMPGRTEEKTHALQNETYYASILRHDFITNYE